MDEGQKKRIGKAQDIALERLGHIFETISMPNFVEIVGHMGGDTVTYKVYDDDFVYER